MSISWVLLFSLLALRSKAVDMQVTEKDESSGPNPRPIPMAQRTKQNQFDSDEHMGRKERLYEERFPHSSGMIQTNFRCDAKPYIPGFYADMEADCKIFHLCLKQKVEHYMCPGNTSFNQETLVCEHDARVHCHLTPTYYVMNADLHPGHPIFEGTKEFAMNKDSDKWLYEMVRDDQNITDQDALERNLIRLLILMKFIDVSDILSDVLAEEEHLESLRGQRSMWMSSSSSQFQDVFGRILQVFPLVPVMYSTDSILDTQRQDSTERGEGATRGPKSLDISDDEGSSADSSKDDLEGRTFIDFSDSPIHKARRIAELLIELIGDIAGRISRTSRFRLVQNYVNYINKFSNPWA